MWQNGKVGDIIVYVQRKDGIRYEVHSSNKLELIVRNRDRSTTNYYLFDGDSVKDQYNKLYDESAVEEMVKSIPEIELLPKDIAARLQLAKKKEVRKEIPPTEPAL